MKEFLSLQIGIILHPVVTFRRMLQHERRLAFSLYTILMFAAGYTVAVVFAFVFGHQSYGIPIFLRIPIEKYYLYESFFLLPLTIGSWIMLAGTVRLISIPFKGTGSFEDTLSILGFPFVILFIFMLIPDVITDYLLRKIIRSDFYWSVVNPVRLFLPSLWVMILHFLAIKETQKMKGRRTLIAFIAAYVPYMGLVMTFMR